MTRQVNLPGLKNISHSNLGIGFEKELETVHDYYRRQRWCDVVKNPSEWKFITDGQYAALAYKNPGGVAKTGNGFFMRRIPSDVDFSGGGKSKNGKFSICFDAKESSAKTFPLSNFQKHQIGRLRESAMCGAIAGAMIYLTVFNRVFFVPAAFLTGKETVWLSQPGRRAKPGTASISLAEFEDHAVEIKNVNGLWDWYAVLVK